MTQKKTERENGLGGQAEKIVDDVVSYRRQRYYESD